MGQHRAASLRWFKHSERSRWFWRVIAQPAGLCLGLYTNLKTSTLRLSIQGTGAGYKGPAVYVNWHGHLPFLTAHHGRYRRWLMISPAPYLEPVARWCEYMGVRVVRGTVGERGREALADLALRLRDGDSVFLAVDGPAGPAFQVKRGCIDLARAARVPLIPVACRARRGRPNPHRWDHWIQFKFFDRIAVYYGEPIWLADGETDEQALGRVTEGLQQAVAMAKTCETKF